MDGGGGREGCSDSTWLCTGAASSALGVHPNTLRTWANQAVIDVRFTPGGQRRFNINSLNAHRQQPILRNNPTTTSRSVTKDDNNQTQTAGAIYCRVSSSKQKDDLERQIEAMCKEFPLHKVYKDIGSGLNYRRKGLSRLLEHVQAGMVKEVVVAHRDRLARFGVEMFEWIIKRAGASLVFLDQKDTHIRGSSEELAADLLAVVHVFSCRINGKRKYQKTRQTGEKETGRSLQRSDAKRKKRKKGAIRCEHDTACNPV